MQESPASRRVTGFDWPVFVRVLRSERYLDCTQVELAALLGVCVSTVAKWEAGAVRPRPRHRRLLRRRAVRSRYLQRCWPKRTYSV